MPELIGGTRFLAMPWSEGDGAAINVVSVSSVGRVAYPAIFNQLLC